MDYLIWGGAALTLTGVAGIAGTIIAVARARRAASDDAALKDRLMRILPWNLAEEISGQLRAAGFKGRLATALPAPRWL